MGSRSWALAALALTLVLLAGGCRTADEAQPSTPARPGQSGEFDVAPTSTVPPTDPSPTTTALSADPPPAVDPSPAISPGFGADLAGLDREALLGVWAADRSAAVERITAAGWGVDEAGVLRGPGGLELDTVASCPSTWADEGPLADADTVPLSWWVAYHGAGPERAQVFLDWLGQAGDVDGRPIELTAGPYGEFDWMVAGWEDEPARRDDHRAHLVELVAGSSRSALAVVGFAGLGGTRGIEQLFDEACLPSIGRRSGLAPLEPEEPRPGPSPWLAPSTTMGHRAIGLALAQLVEAEYGAERVGLLVMDHEFGETLSAAVLDRAEAGRFDVVVARHDPAGSDMEAAVARLVAADTDVVVAATAGHPCVLAARAVAAQAPGQPIVTPEYCANPYQFGENDDGALDDLLSLRSVVDGTEDPVADTELGRLARSAFGDQEFNHGSTAEWASIWQAVQILQIAAELPGGLTRTNIALAGWSFEGRFPLIEGGITTAWPHDDQAVTSARLHRWDGDAEAWRPTEVAVRAPDSP